MLSTARTLTSACVSLCAAVLACGCGYIGEPLPPLLNIPGRVTDLAAVQRGGKIFVQFSLPKLTTEGTVLKSPVRQELWAGESAGGAFSMDAWAASAKVLSGGIVRDGRALYEFPAAADWMGKDIIFGVKVIGASGRDAGWSNLSPLSVVQPPAQPTGLRAKAVAEGVRLTWTGSGGPFRVYRRAGEEPSFGVVANTDQTEWTDVQTEYGKPYRYLVQTIVKTGTGEAQSDISEEALITPEDHFPPAVPSGLTAVVGPGAIDLVWERNTELDLAGYQVYRAGPGQAMERIADTREAPSYSDRKIESGKTYRYTVSALDKSGNESEKSAPVEVTAQ